MYPSLMRFPGNLFADFGELHRHGVLKLTIPKIEHARPRRIEAPDDAARTEALEKTPDPAFRSTSESACSIVFAVSSRMIKPAAGSACRLSRTSPTSTARTLNLAHPAWAD